jgi:hypothetical protein
MKPDPRTMIVKRAEVELSQFLLQGLNGTG